MYAQRLIVPPPSFVPKGKRVIAVGDIHGQLEHLQQLHSKIQQSVNAVPEYQHTVVYLGDYIDRGLHVRETINFLLNSPIENAESVFLKGNHEDALSGFMKGTMAYDRWLRWGGDATLRSYGVQLLSPTANDAALVAMRHELAKKIPASHHAFFDSLKLMHEEGDYVFVHAGIRPNVPLDKQTPQDLMMIREDFIDRPLVSDKTIIHGHTIFAQPHIGERSIGIDTGAYATGILTAIILEEDRYEFVSTQ